MHRIVLARFEHLSLEAERDAALSERSNRCETLLNITCAEMNRIIDEHHADIAETARRLFLQAAERQEEVRRRMDGLHPGDAIRADSVKAIEFAHDSQRPLAVAS